MTRTLGVGARQEIERKIVSQCINDLHNAGYALQVNNGGDEDELEEPSLDHNEVLGAMMASDEDYLYAHKGGERAPYGWVYFVYGNDGPDVINDYSTRLEDDIGNTLELAEAEERRVYG